MRSTQHLMIATTCVAADRQELYRHAERAVCDELARSFAEYPQLWKSAEEGVTVLLEEIDELGDEIRSNHTGRQQLEAVQVGAMAIRMITDLGGGAGSVQQRRHDAMDAARTAREVVGPRGRQFASSHEGFGFVKREAHALWDAVIAGSDTSTPAARVAAAAVRFLVEVPQVGRRPVTGAMK